MKQAIEQLKTLPNPKKITVKFWTGCSNDSFSSPDLMCAKLCCEEEKVTLTSIQWSEDGKPCVYTAKFQNHLLTQEIKDPVYCMRMLTWFYSFYGGWHNRHEKDPFANETFQKHRIWADDIASLKVSFVVEKLGSS